ncbi:predicted protein [Lichtheimia corymbifera JMRC:FSU:9682]|uniref:Uncharacterized protein n=1 Tax=Lichtheimia corymbifera JMRC:FSU:9682 TaxID=1263082 RepID=A0A068SBX0_9FUNG|nr:predicted protein [Lichtheimia corymbifera JMRC:FSU:9682]
MASSKLHLVKPLYFTDHTANAKSEAYVQPAWILLLLLFAATGNAREAQMESIILIAVARSRLDNTFSSLLAKTASGADTISRWNCTFELTLGVQMTQQALDTKSRIRQ